MDKIFKEIKKAIEEEMRNAESGPSPGGSRPQGGRRAQEYAEWLKEEQTRLRGSGEQYSEPAGPEVPSDYAETQRPQRRPRRESREDRQVEERPSRRDRSPDQRRQQRSQERQQRRESYEEAKQRRELEVREDRPRSTQSTPRRERQTQREPVRGAAMQSRIQRLLRSPNGLRQAFLLREVVSKPVSMREKDDHLIW